MVRGHTSIVLASTLSAIVLLLGARPAAQQGTVATERASGPTIDFTVVQDDGSPIADLQASEVEVRVGDRVRTIRSLRLTGAASSTAGKVYLPLPYGTNDGVAAGRRFALVVDQESFSAGREQLFRSAVEGLVREMTPTDRVMVAALPFGGVRLPFTSDKTRIKLAMDRIAGQGSRNESGSDLACRTRRFLESLEGWLQEQPAADTPITLVLFTAGLAGPRRDAPQGILPGMCELLVDQFRQVATAAGSARANFYILQPADVGLSAGAARTTSIASDIGSDNPLEGIEHLAGATGAARFSLDETGTSALRRVARESAAHYVAELEPIAGDSTRSRPVGIRVARKGVTVRSRPEIRLGAVVAPARPARLAVTDLLASSDPYPELRLRIGGFTVRDAEAGRVRVGVLIEPADASASLTSAGAILVGADGQVAAHWFAKSAADRPLLGAMLAPPGIYRLRVAALDGEGRVGAAEDTIDASLVAVGPISLGSLMLGVSRAGATTPQLEFSGEPTAIAYFDLYGGVAGLPLSTRLEIARDVDGPPIAALPLALARADEARVVATGTIPLGALAPGDYIVRGIVRLESGETARVMRTLRKVPK